MKSNITIVFATIFLLGCQTIQFNSEDTVNSESLNNNPDVTMWHHNVVLSLIEISDPVHLNEQCEGVPNSEEGWSTVKTETNFISGLADFATGILVPLDLWTPKVVEIGCQ